MFYFIYKVQLRSDYMFRPSFLDHHQVVCPIQGNYTICDIKSLVFNEISFSSIIFIDLIDENEISLNTNDLILHIV
jgi:hypothetical protein